MRGEHHQNGPEASMFLFPRFPARSAQLTTQAQSCAVCEIQYYSSSGT